MKTTSSSTNVHSLSDDQLNNFIIDMRRDVRKATDFFIQKRIKRLNQFDKNKDVYSKKIRSNEKYITNARSLNVDKISKFLLFNDKSEEEIMKETNFIEQRVAFQIGKSKILANIINKFKKYPDWQEMASFLIMKNSGKSYRPKKQEKSQISWLPMPNNINKLVPENDIKEEMSPNNLAAKYTKINNESLQKKPVDKSKEPEVDVREQKKIELTSLDQDDFFASG
ncbi:MAG: hypothetical protein MHMPM18_000386 [Marteilia pararefringens]